MLIAPTKCRVQSRTFILYQIVTPPITGGVYNSWHHYLDAAGDVGHSHFLIGRRFMGRSFWPISVARKVVVGPDDGCLITDNFGDFHHPAFLEKGHVDRAGVVVPDVAIAFLARCHINTD